MSSMIWLALAATITTQQVPTRTLGVPEVEYREPFSQVDGVRELRDGRVIVVDSRERIIHAVNMRTGTATKIGREGSGPGEYRIPLRIVPLPGDSSAVHDMAGRPLVVTPQGTAGEISLTMPGGPVQIGMLSATDARGRIYSQVMMADSAGIERLDRGTGRRDTIARVSSRLVSPLTETGRPSRGAVPVGGGVAAARGGQIPPFASRDQWAVAPDGRVAIVSVDPYRVRFVATNGAVMVGPVLPVARVPVDNALRQFWRIEKQRPGPVLSVSAGGQMTATSRPPRYEEPRDWPDQLPAFLDQAVMFAPDGMLWVNRAVAAESPPVIDVIDATGKLAQQVVLPKGARLVGFGQGTVYLVRVDSDDLQYLQRYRLP